MTNIPHTRLRPVQLKQVSISGPFWAAWQDLNRTVTLPAILERFKATGRIDAWRLTWKPGQPNPPHHGWDSEVAKWIEAAAYSLATHPDAGLERTVDGLIEMIVAAQQPDGYINSHFTVVEPDNRWQNLRDMHELYCAGHLIEAAVACYEATGKRRLLDALCRYADYIDTVFGPEEGKLRGYPGHEEIELALVRLYGATGERRYLNLAKFFIDERGRQPHYFDIEAEARGEEVRKNDYGRDYRLSQSHLPAREQTTALGHAVRAMYLYSGMADVAAESSDETLLAAARRLWANVTERRMYVTGGVGSSGFHERFTYDYDLPNETAYTETCAAIGMVFWAQRMLQVEADASYADVMERALYNGVLSGLSLDGCRFFYANPLEVNPQTYEQRPETFRKACQVSERQEWFGTACCPPNMARLLASLGRYVYAQAPGTLYVHLYTGSEAQFDVEGQPVVLQQETDYPWQGSVRITVSPAASARFVLALRIPGWSQGASLAVNGRPVELAPVSEKGYAHIARTWHPDDMVTLELPMPVERIEAHPGVRDDSGRVALQRGPLVYCLEEVDNGANLQDIVLPHDAELQAGFEEGLFGGMVTITGLGWRCDLSGWEGKLYRRLAARRQPVPVKAVPYHAWGNRGRGEVLVWIRGA